MTELSKVLELGGKTQQLGSLFGAPSLGFVPTLLEASPQNGRKPPENGRKKCPKRPKIGQKNALKWSQRVVNTTPKRSWNVAKIIPKWRGKLKNSPKSPKMTLSWPHFGLKRSLEKPEAGSEMAKKSQNVNKKHEEKHLKAIWTVGKPNKTLKIHPDHFKEHQLTAHFHRLKRRFWPAF